MFSPLQKKAHFTLFIPLKCCYICCDPTDDYIISVLATATKTAVTFVEKGSLAVDSVCVCMCVCVCVCDYIKMKLTHTLVNLSLN